MTVTAEVTALLRQRIIGGRYKGGQQLPQETIAAELAVSRIPVREAFLQLESEGLIVLQPHKGAVVSMLSIDDAREIFDARYLLEPALVRAAMARLSASDVERVRTMMGLYETAVRRKEPPEELSRLNWGFHTSMCEPARRPRTLAIVTSLHNSADRYLRMQINFTRAQKAAVEDHQKIFVAYAEQNADLTTQLLYDHIRSAENEVFDCLGRQIGFDIKRDFS